MNLGALELRDALVIAALIGFAGPFVAGLSTRAIGQRALFAELLRSGSAISEAQCRGPIARAFAPFVAAGSGSLPLSPDAITTAISGALEKEREAAIARLRPWSYLPLLVGLAITAISLRALLEITKGQQTDVSRLTGEMGQALLGTVAGVTAAFVASVMQVVWTGRIDSAGATAHRYLYQVFVPALPNLRVSLQFDEQALNILTERTSAVVEAYRQALEPLVETMSAGASRSAEAAAVAAEAFSDVAAAVKGAKGLKDAAAKLAAAAEHSEEAAATLSRQIEPIQDLVAQSSKHQAAASRATEVLATRVGDLSGAVVTFKSAVIDEPGSIVRAASEIAAGVQQTKGVITQLVQTSGNLGTEVGVLRETVANVGDAKLEQWTAELRLSIAAIKDGLTESLAGVPGRSAQEMQRLGTSAEATAGAVAKVGGELQRVQEALQRISSVASNATIPSPTEPHPRGEAPDFGPILRELQRCARQVEDILRCQKDIHTVLVSQAPKRRGFRWNPFLKGNA